MSSDQSSRRGSNACSQSSLSSTGSSLTATRDLWRLRQTMHCLEKCDFYHGSLNRNKAREKMRRCRPGCFLIRDSNDPQYLFTLQQTLHFVGPCATRIAFIQGLFRFQDSNGQIMMSNAEAPTSENRGFPCVLQLIEHYSCKYSEMSVIALRYPVSKEGSINMEGIGPAHTCFVEQPGDDVIQTPRIIHPEMAASLAGSSAPSCMSCTSHSGPTKLESDRVMEPVERVNRSNSDGSIAHRTALNHCTMISLEASRHRKSLDHGHICEIQTNHIHAQDLKTSLNELQDRIQLQNEIPESVPIPVSIFPGLEPLISTERRSSVDMNSTSDSKLTSVDQYGRSDSILTHLTVGPKVAQCAAKKPSTLPVCVAPPCVVQSHSEPSSDYNLNSSFGNIQIDLDNLGAILGSTSITVDKPHHLASKSEPNSSSSTQFKQNIPQPSDYK